MTIGCETLGCSNLLSCPSSTLSADSLKARPLRIPDRCPPPAMLTMVMIQSLSHITGANIGRRIGINGEGCRTTLSLSPLEYCGLYGSIGIGRACMAMITYYCQQLEICNHVKGQLTIGNTSAKMTAFAKLLPQLQRAAEGKPISVVRE